MMVPWKSVFVALAACALLGMSLTGCGREAEKPSDLPDLVPIAAVVKFQGEPVPDAKVLFSPVSGKYSAAGVTDSQGRAVMKTDGTYEGVPAGSYKVAVVKLPPTQSAPQSSESLQNPEDYEKQYQATATSGAAAVQSALPAKYASFETSGLTATVPPAEGNEILFELQQ
ncbi:MAG: carboxypeptidase regulatory-like domain-containing protein [Thermogutta sp.]|nr:carboxypeptidase regulatory-like domain-containing protein [Thermogutta sp.]